MSDRREWGSRMPHHWRGLNKLSCISVYLHMLWMGQLRCVEGLLCGSSKKKSGTQRALEMHRATVGFTSLWHHKSAHNHVTQRRKLLFTPNPTPSDPPFTISSLSLPWVADLSAFKSHRKTYFLFQWTFLLHHQCLAYLSCIYCFVLSVCMLL